MSKDKELIEKFIFNSDVQSILSEVTKSVMDFNILEITGMGAQEIKHSSLLSWLLGDNEHNLENRFFEKILEKIIANNYILQEELKHYLYLPNNERDLVVYREKDNIDLLVVDKSNKIIFVIENKVYASERTSGEDGGQLLKYEKIVLEKYPKKHNTNDENGYTHYYIYLTIGFDDPFEKDNWLKLSYKMICECADEILMLSNISDKTRLVLSSYVDLLKRKNIVEDKELEEICSKIWDNKDYAKAFDIIYNYRKTNLDKFYDELCSKFDFYDGYDSLKTDVTEELYKKVFDKSWDESEKYAIDICIEKRGKKIWIGYRHPDLNDLNNKQLNKTYLNLTKKEKIQFETVKYKIRESELEGFEFDSKEIQDKMDNTTKMIEKLIINYSEVCKNF